MPSTSVQKILPLESLRGLAALAVVLFHFKTNSFLADNAFIRNAYLMVDLFFVLSGFVIALNYWERLDGIKDILNFQARRFWRLYPLHLVTLIGFLCIEVAKYLFAGHTGMSAANPAFSKNNLSAFVSHLFLLQAFSKNELTFNYPSWSISTEFYAYLIFAVMTCCKKCRIVMPALISLVAGWYLYQHNGGSLSLHNGLSFIRCLYSFFLGAVVFQLHRLFAIKLNSLPAAMLFCLAVTVIYLTSKTSNQLYIPPLFGCLVFVVARLKPDMVLRKILSQPKLVYLGTISYSLYMIHAGIWWVLNQIIHIGFHRMAILDENNTGAIALGNASATSITLLGVALIVFISGYTHRWIENRFRHGLNAAPAPRSGQTIPV